MDKVKEVFQRLKAEGKIQMAYKVVRGKVANFKACR